MILESCAWARIRCDGHEIIVRVANYRSIAVPHCRVTLSRLNCRGAEHRGNEHHEKDGKRDPDQQGRKLGLVVDEQLIGELDDSCHDLFFRGVGWTSGAQSPEVLTTLVK